MKYVNGLCMRLDIHQGKAYRLYLGIVQVLM